MVGWRGFVWIIELRLIYNCALWPVNRTLREFTLSLRGTSTEVTKQSQRWRRRISSPLELNHISANLRLLRFARNDKLEIASLQDASQSSLRSSQWQEGAALAMPTEWWVDGGSFGFMTPGKIENVHYGPSTAPYGIAWICGNSNTEWVVIYW